MSVFEQGTCNLFLYNSQHFWYGHCCSAVCL